MRRVAPGTLDPGIVIIDIDAASLARVGRWPWPRERLAALVDELVQRQQVAALGLDLLFPEPELDAAALALRPLVDEAARRGADPGWARLQARWQGDARFAQALAGGPTVLGFFLSDDARAPGAGTLPPPWVTPGVTAAAWSRQPLSRWPTHTGNLPELTRAAAAAGFINHRPGEDGIVRDVPLLGSLGPTGDVSDDRRDEGPRSAVLHPALSLALLSVAEGRSSPPRPRGTAPDWAPVFATAPGGDRLTALRLRTAAGALTLPVDRHGALRVAFRGPGGPQGGSFRYVPAAEVLEGRLAPGALAGRTVLLGTSVPSLGDLRSTPTDRAMPGVEVHAHVLSAVREGRWLQVPDWQAAWALLLAALLSAAAVGAVRRLRGPRLPLALAALAVAALAIDHLMLRAGWLLPLASPLAAAALTAVLALARAWWTEGRSRRALQGLFGAYVPPEIVERMAAEPERYARAGLLAENREITLLFCDLRNFTSAAQHMAPEQLREVVNLFFSRMTRIIRAHGGTLDKFIGDAIMAFWGAPTDQPGHAASAVAAAREMAAAMPALNAELARRGLPALGLGIGLHTGVACVGDMGSDLRRSYTAMGDTVNLASRLEGLTKSYGVDLLCSAATCEAARAAGDDGQWVELDLVRVKGRATPVRLFTCRSATEREPSCARAELDAWRLALAATRGQDWPSALNHLAAMPVDGWLHVAADRLRRRVADLQSHPPGPDWDGVHDFDHK